MILLAVSGLLAVVLVAVFAFQNSAPVVVRFFRAELHVSLGLALTLSAAAGMIAGVLVSAAALFRKSMTIAALRRHNDAKSPPPPR